MAAPNRLPSTNPNEAAKLPANLDFRTYQELKISLHRFLLNRLDLEKIAAVPTDQTSNDQTGNDQTGNDQTRWQAFATIQEVVSQIKVPFTPQEREQFSRTVLDEVFALGPLEPLLQDPAVDDILVNGAKEVYVERGGVLEETKVVFKDDAHLMRIIQKIVAAIGRRIDASSPMVDARLADGSRVNIIVPPLALDGPHISIRRFGHIPISDADLLASQALTPHMLGLLKASVAARLNIVISGGTGAGKTTLLNVLSGYISAKERIVTIEDSAELQLKQRHVVRLECRPPDPHGKGAVAARQLVINSLRMRPNRIVVGEVRGEEALDMLQAMNTGHDGSMTTIHANSPRDALARMETMGMMANLNLPERAIRKQIASAVSLFVQVARFTDGTRRITHITEITGMESDVVSLQDIFVFEKQGLSPEGKVIGSFVSTGIRPKFSERLKAAGFDLPQEMFDNPGGRWR